MMNCKKNWIMKKMNKNWLCIYTNAREEHLAFQELLMQGLNLYFPRYKRTVRHARKTHVHDTSRCPGS